MRQAVAALLAEDTSAIVTLKASGLNSPKLLDGKRYASYGARWVLHLGHGPPTSHVICFLPAVALGVLIL